MNTRRLAVVIAALLPFTGQAAGNQGVSAPLLKKLQLQRTADQIYIIGSVAMRDYILAVAGRLVKNAHLPMPIIDNQGSARGMEAFCSGIGLDTPDVAAVSRQIRAAELDTCRDHGVTDVIVIQIGYDASVLVSRLDDQAYPLDLATFYRAVAAELPRDYNDFIPNQYNSWHEVDPSLPDTSIRLIIPVRGLGGRAFLEDQMLQAACRNISEISTIFGADDRVKQCITMRSDGRIVDADNPFAENVIRMMATLPLGTLALMPLQLALKHREAFRVQPLNGVMPSRETVSNHQYQFIRPFYFLVKKSHVKNYWGKGLVSGLREFITEVTRESTIGPNGYLAELGLVPGKEEKKRNQIREASLRLDTIDR